MTVSIFPIDWEVIRKIVIVKEKETMKKLRKVACCALAVLLVLAFAGCQGAAVPSTSASASEVAPPPSSSAALPPYMLAEGKTLKIGWSVHQWSPYNTAMDEYIHSYMDYLSGGRAEVITVCAEGDALKQLADVESLIEQDIDILIIKAQDETTCANALGEAQAKGIKVIVLQRKMLTDNYDFYFGPDMTTVGQQMAEACLKKFPNGNFNYCIFYGSATAANDRAMVDTVHKVFKDSGLPGIVELNGQ